MKSYLSGLMIVAMVACTTSAFGQGTVVFANNTGLVMQPTSATDQTVIPVPKGGGFVQLAYAPAGTRLLHWDAMSPMTTTSQWLAANPGWTLDSTPVGFNTPVPGKFNGGTITLNGVAAGANAEFIAFGWSGGASFDAALVMGVVGVSGVFTSATGGAGTPPTPAVNLNAVFPGIMLGVPEPGTFALVSLGAAAMLRLRRRK